MGALRLLVEVTQNPKDTSEYEAKMPQISELRLQATICIKFAFHNDLMCLTNLCSPDAIYLQPLKSLLASLVRGIYKFKNTLQQA